MIRGHHYEIYHVSSFESLYNLYNFCFENSDLVSLVCKDILPSLYIIIIELVYEKFYLT